MPTAADAVVISWETVPAVYNPDTAVCNFALKYRPPAQHPCGFGRAAVPSKLVMMPVIRQIGRQPPRP